MKTITATLALACGLAGLAACTTTDTAGPAPAPAARPLSAHLMGGPNGDPDGMGHATFRVNAAQNQVCYDMTVEKITLPAGAAHIHLASSGAPVLPLTAPSADGKASGCATAAADLVNDILQNPGNYYVNVHTADFRGGAIRGTLTR